MTRRLVPLLFVVLLAVGPVAALPGVAAADAPATTQEQPTRTTNDTLDGITVVADTATADDGGTYLVGTSDTIAGNATVVRQAADGTVRWTHTFASNETRSAAVAVASGPLPGAYVLEQRTPAYDPANPSAGVPTIRLHRFGPDGAVEWTRDLGNASRYGSRARLLATPEGSVVLATGTVDRSESRYREGTRLREITADGTTAWSRTYGGGTPTALARSNDGGYLVGGEAGFGDGWVLRTDADGDVELNVTFDGFNDRRIVGVAPTEDGGVLVGGSAETSFARESVWAARLDAGGDVLWSRTYGDGTDRAYARTAVPTDDGLLMLHTRNGEFSEQDSLLTRVTADGAYGSQPVATNTSAVTTMAREGDTVTVYGFEYLNRSTVGRVTTATVPTAEAVELRADADLDTNETFYRGQNLRLAGGATYGLYKLPTEYTEYDEPIRVRTLRGEEGEAVFETATLERGRYAVRNSAGLWLTLDDGRPSAIAESADEAAFTLDEQYLRLTDPTAERFGRIEDSTVVETYEGDSTVTFGVRSEPENFTAQVSLYRLKDGAVPTTQVGEALSADDGWGGMEAPDHVTIGDTADRNVTLDASALDAGLYRVSVTGAETADASDPARTTLVVVNEERPVSLSLNRTSLTVPENESAAASLTLGGTDAGISALRLEANRTGAPAVRLDLDLTRDIDYRSASGGSGWSSRESTAHAESLEIVSAPNGTFEVGTFAVSDSDYRDTPGGTNTAHVGIAYVIDENGVPYTVPDDIAVTYEVIDEDGEADDGSEGGASGSGHEGGSASGGGSASASASHGGSA